MAKGKWKKALDKLDFIEPNFSHSPLLQMADFAKVHSIQDKRKEDRDKEKKAYAKAHVTNDLDFELRHELDFIQHSWLQKKPKKAYKKFKRLFDDYKSPRALFGMAAALNNLAMTTQEPMEAAKWQGKAADKFCQGLSLPDIPLFLFMSSGRTCIELRKHRQERGELINALKAMKAQFPNAYEYASDLALEHLKRRDFVTGEQELKQIRQRWPQKSRREKFLHYIVLKWLKLSSSVPVIQSFELSDVSEAVKSLADFYQASGFDSEASFFYETGAQLGIFPSKYQRQIYDNNFYLPGLESKPVWDLTELPGRVGESLRQVSQHWQMIRNEGLEALFGSSQDFQAEAQLLSQDGRWQQLVLFEKGRKNAISCDLTPRTCALIEKLKLNNCTRGQVKFSVMHPGTHVWPHAGPTNTRLRAHLGLLVPRQNVEMRVADRKLKWSEGKIFVIDDSFEHEVWHKAPGEIRLVLLIDFWHPDIPEKLRSKLPELPMNDSQNRTAIFHISGIVSALESPPQFAETTHPKWHKIDS